VIFVTVGNTDPFDRLIQAVERWSLARTPREDIYAQIGAGEFLPTSFPAERFLDPLTFESNFKKAELVISHAGMGTIITALELGKPLLVMPKRASLGEQRNEHHLATVEHVCRQKSISVANDEHEFPAVLDQLLATIRAEHKEIQERASNTASTSLLDFVRVFVHQSAPIPAPNWHERPAIKESSQHQDSQGSR
jgi:UDP-N-acetylglucosamine transferase subunit ALG13